MDLQNIVRDLKGRDVADIFSQMGLDLEGMPFYGDKDASGGSISKGWYGHDTVWFKNTPAFNCNHGSPSYQQRQTLHNGSYSMCLLIYFYFLSP